MKALLSKMNSSSAVSIISPFIHDGQTSFPTQYQLRTPIAFPDTSNDFNSHSAAAVDSNTANLLNISQPKNIGYPQRDLKDSDMDSKGEKQSTRVLLDPRQSQSQYNYMNHHPQDSPFAPTPIPISYLRNSSSSLLVDHQQPIAANILLYNSHFSGLEVMFSCFVNSD